MTSQYLFICYYIDLHWSAFPTMERIYSCHWWHCAWQQQVPNWNWRYN